ncbi:carboxylesterase/lipase family protein [Streptomyces sp. NPDC055749]
MTVFTTEAGRVRGRPATRDTGVAAVLGIPYAAPPFGAGRFREPGPAPAWDGVRDCVAFGPVAPQSAELPGAPCWSPGDEDILTVNIWTPGGEGDALPVLVWIHGGAYVFGSSAQPDFDGAALAGQGLVVVTLNYRLGFEGFGHVPAAEGEDACPDNRGLLDQIAALEWVRDNIAAFGGAPADVTVAGQSSGATAVACLMVMDRARGLFRRAIAHSAVNACAPLRTAARTTAEVAAAAGVPPSRAGLLSASPQELVAASDQVVDGYRRDPASGQRHYDPAIYGPVVDGDTLRADPLTAIAAGAGREVDLMVCHTTEEFWLLDAVGSSAKITTDDQLSVFASDYALPAELVDGYRALMPGAPALDVFLAVYGDLLFAEYSSRLADSHARAGGKAYLSRFDRRRGGSGEPVRAWHCADVPFAFGTLDEASVHFLIGGPPGPADRALSGRMMRSWAEFATTGDPGWPPIGATTGAVMVWGAEEGGSETPGEAFRELWRTAGYPLLAP